MNAFTENLLEKAAIARKAMKPARWLEYDYLLNNLTFVWQFARASYGLLGLGAKILQANKQSSSGFEMRLARYYERHSAEEQDHEKWYSEDLFGAGVETENLPPDMLAAAMAGTQYFLIRHEHPSALLGYMAFIETAPMSLEAVAALENIHGREICRTIRIHAESDVGHSVDLIEIIDALPKQFQSLVELSMHQTAAYCTQAAEKF